MTLLTKMLVTAGAILVMTGCRNTSSATLSPIGGSAVSPLSPVQGSASLSPIQQSSGVSTFGESTRVPPPPTGSYSSPTNYGAAPGGGAPTSNYAPTGLSPSGATIGATGMTLGVTELTPTIAPSNGTTFGADVRQTGWVGEVPAGTNTIPPGSGFAPALPPPTQAPPTTNPGLQPRSGGMQVIDLTQSAFPPGYVPPQNRPGAAPLPQAAPPQAPINQTQYGQPTGSTFVRSSTVIPSSTNFGGDPALQTSGRPTSAMLPSTEPFPTTATAGTDELQWRRPSPRF